MESNSELKIENNMEPKSTYTRKEKFNDSFFIRKPIISDVNNDHTKDINEHAFAFSYTQPHSMKTTSTQDLNLSLSAGEAGEQPVAVNYHKKTAFMKKFLRNAFPIAIAFVIATPIAWYFMNNWLQDYVYRINISWWTFILGGVASIVIALATVSFQAIRAAVANPVDSLRAE